MESQVNDNSNVGLSEESEIKLGHGSDSLDSIKNVPNNQVADVMESTESGCSSLTDQEMSPKNEPLEGSCEEDNTPTTLDVLDNISNEKMITDMDNSLIDDIDKSDSTQLHIEPVESQTGQSILNDSKAARANAFEKCDVNAVNDVDMEVTSNEETENSLDTCKFKESDEDNTMKESEQENLNKSESAFQRLATLGVITTEEPIEESKESLLKKLASRGSISITPSSSGAITSSSSFLSIIPEAAHKIEAGQISPLIKPKNKKIKIDPGLSTDIDKDLDSLLNLLSSTNTENEKIETNLITNNTTSTDNMVQPEIDNVGEAALEQKDGLSGVVEQSTKSSNDEMDVHEIDTEIIEESTISHSAEQAEDDERIEAPLSQPRNVIEEGSAEILVNSKNVFYNNVQEFNRDMSIAALTVFSEMHQQDPRTRNKGKKRKATTDINESESNDASEDNSKNVFEPGKKSENGITILEALSATGLRSIRYAREIPGVKEIIANDISEYAVESIMNNIKHNGVEDLVSTSKSDAALLMYQKQSIQEWYDAIDLDPYGCPSRFLDSAVQVVRDGGLLLVTCTDMAVLAGNSSETCHAKYGAVSFRTQACHEMAIRIALQCLESHANRYGRYIVPLLSFSVDFYIRVVVQVYTSPVTCKKTTSKLAMVFQCTGCNTHHFQPLGAVSQENANTQPKFFLPHCPVVNTNCVHCQHRHQMAGPIWTAPIYNTKFIENMLRVVETGRFGTSKRMQGMLEVLREELPDVPLYYTIHGLCSRLHCTAIPLIDIRSAILNAGYRVSSSHTAPTAIKTNAPSKLIWDIMRCWVHMNPVSQKRLIAGSVPATIIMEPPCQIANFDIHPKARPSSSMRKLLRYQQNPEKNWGPGMRARCNIRTPQIRIRKVPVASFVRQPFWVFEFLRKIFSGNPCGCTVM